MSPLASVRAALERAGQGLSLNDLMDRVLAGSAQLWSSPLACVVTEFDADELHIWLAGGDMRSVLAFQAPLEAYVRALGLKAITVDGRAGWFRVLRPLGYVRDGEVLRKVL